MTAVNSYNVSQIYKDEYFSWRSEKDFQKAKRQEYLRRNPDAIADYDLQRAKILLNSVDMMDKSLKGNSNKISVAVETAYNLGLGYAAIGGATLGFLATKFKFVKNLINKTTLKYPHAKNIINTGISVIGGALGILAAYPAYTFLSNVESKIHRKRKFETMENELKDPKIFVVLDDEQKKIFKENLEKNSPKRIKGIKKEVKSLKEITKEALYFDKEQAKFKEKYREDKSLYNNDLTSKEIKDAKKDKVLLNVLVKEINTNSQSYTEKMRKITDNIITTSFALGSLFAIGYERIAKKHNWQTSSIPAGSGIFLLTVSTFFANWMQRRASHVGRFKAIQELKDNPELLVYISKRKTETIDDEEIQVDKIQKTNLSKFLKDFFKHNKEYTQWKKTNNYTGNDISKAMESVEISAEQLRDGERLQKNLFKTLYKIDKNTQKYSNDIEVLSETIKYPATLILGTLGSVFGMKYLANLRNTTNPKEIFKNTSKYLGIITLATIPSIIINSYFAKAQKMGARIADMITMKELEDYRFFADYSRFKES